MSSTSFPFQFQSNPPWNFSECQSIIKDIVDTCYIRSPFFSSGLPGAPIYNTTEIINNFLNCVNTPLQLDAAQCAELQPGFCGSILQYVNGAWDIYRSPGITEVTVGLVNANYPNVTSALASSGNTNCRFIRITDSITEPIGNINIPDNTLVYLDPGVVWTLSGALILNGAFVLTGATNISSSIVEYGGQPIAIIGNGSFICSNLHLKHIGLNNNELFIQPTIPSLLKNLIVDQNTTNSFLSDTIGAFTNMIINDLTINYVGALVAPSSINITQPTSKLFCQTLTIKDNNNVISGNVIVSSASTNSVWKNIRFVMPLSNVIFTFSGNISTVNDENLNSTLILLGNSLLNNCTIGTFVTNGDNSLIMHMNANTVDLNTNQNNNLQIYTLVVNTNFSGDEFYTGYNSKMVNVNYNGNVNITTTLPNSPTSVNVLLSDILINTNVNWTITIGNNIDMTIQNCYCNGGHLEYNLGVGGGSNTGFLKINNLSCQNLHYGDTGTIVQGNLIVSNANIGGFLIVNTTGSMNIEHFVVRQPTVTLNGLDIINCASGLWNNGSVWSSCRIANNIQKQQLSGIEFYGNISLTTNQCTFSNITAFANTGGLAPVTYCTVDILGDENTFNNFQTHKPLTLPGDYAGGALTISGNNNMLDSFHLHGSSIVVTGISNHLQNFRVRGCSLSVNSPPGPQNFLIHGSQTKISNIHLGATFIDNATNGLFTTDGYGSNIDGAYTIELGNSTLPQPTTSLQVSNFSLYPRRGQNAGVAIDISGALAIGAQTLTIDVPYSILTNCRVWSYPGNAAPLVDAHQNIASTFAIAAGSTFSQFDSIIVGYGQETNIAAATDIGNYNCQAANVCHKNINTYNINALLATDNQFISCLQRNVGVTNILNVANTICVGNRGFNLASIAACTGQSVVIPNNSNT